MDVISRLRDVDFMSQLTEGDLEQLARITQRQRFVAGEAIIQQGDFTDRFFIVDEGGVHFRKTDIEGFEKAVGSAGAGDHFGKAMFTSQEPSEYTAEALSQATVYVIHCEDFEKLTEQDPGLLQRMPEVVAARHRMTRGFKWLTPGEVVGYATHRHPLMLVQALFLPIAVGLLLLAIVAALSYFAVLEAFGFAGLEFVLAGVIVVAVFLWGAWTHLDFYDDDFIVTNKRVIHSEKVLFTSEKRDEIPITRIQSITLQRTTPLESFFGISTIEVRSAGMQALSFNGVADGEKVRELIEKQRGQLRARQQAEDRERFRNRVGSELRHYVLRVPMEEPETQVTRRRSVGLGERFRAARHAAFGYEFHDGPNVTYRKHLIALGHQLRVPFLGIFIIVVLLLIYYAMPVFGVVSEQGFLIAMGVAAFAMLLWAGWQWEDWRNDIYMLTENSIVDIERLPFGFDSKETTALLVNVQDARTLRPGLSHGIFNYGNVEISVAGGGPPMVFHDVAHPQEIQAEIFRRLEKFRLKQRERETSMQSRNVIDALVAYHRLLMQERAESQPAIETKTVEERQEVEALSRVPPPAPSGLALPVVSDREPEFSEFPPPAAYGDEG